MDTELMLPNLTSTLQLTGCLLGLKPPGWTYPEHHHPLFELLYCRSGEASIQVKQQTVSLKEGDWLVLRPGVRHSLHNPADRDYGFFNVHFDVDDQRIRSLLGADSFVLLEKERAEASRLGSYIEELVRVMLGREEAGWQLEGVRTIEPAFEEQIAIQAFILLILRELIAWNAAKQVNQEASTSYEIDEAHRIEALLQEEALHGEVSVSGIARRLGMSRSRCTKVFTKVYGLSPRQYISKRKLKEAKELLIRTNQTIESIAGQLGFGSASHFSRQFRRWTGMSPNQYRPKHPIGMGARDIVQ